MINLQNEYIIYKLRDNPPSVSARKLKFSNTNSLFFSGTKNKSSFNETPSRILTIDHDYPRKESQSYLSPRKWD